MCDTKTTHSFVFDVTTLINNLRNIPIAKLLIRQFSAGSSYLLSLKFKCSLRYLRFILNSLSQYVFPLGWETKQVLRA
jgi:hypothetical protein